MPAPPVLVGNGEHKFPLPEQNAAGFAQRVTRIISIRSLCGCSVQLENCESFSLPKFLDRTEANILPADLESRFTILKALELQKQTGMSSAPSPRIAPSLPVKQLLLRRQSEDGLETIIRGTSYRKRSGYCH